MGYQTLKYNGKLDLELGGSLSDFQIGYHTWGSLNKQKDNVIWICHALTANSDAQDWWPGMIGNGYLFDPSHYFIVCANIPGSCYGTSGPLSENPETGKPYYRTFPDLTFRDVVNSHEILRKHLGIQKIHTVIGGSIGGQQAVEYSIMYPDLIDHLVFIASSVAYAPWGIAFGESQRLAIEADQSFYEDIPEGGLRGLRAARSIALLSYRNDIIYNKTQSEESCEVVKNFRASSYQDYQGDKLVKRFNAYSYYTLLNLSDTHNVGRNRGSKEGALKKISAKALSIGISSDLLFPVYEQKFLAEHVENACFKEIDSLYGHDGFLIETDKLTQIIQTFYNKDEN
ncbi:MAG: homoserine O-acetyltransferase [Bacteroidetes bacterium]|nr:MAG: homoserine O-acetyltransferase [Bacteroidota bacterium]